MRAHSCGRCGERLTWLVYTTAALAIVHELLGEAAGAEAPPAAASANQVGAWPLIGTPGHTVPGRRTRLHALQLQYLLAMSAHGGRHCVELRGEMLMRGGHASLSFASAR